MLLTLRECVLDEIRLLLGLIIAAVWQVLSEMFSLPVLLSLQSCLNLMSEHDIKGIYLGRHGASRVRPFRAKHIVVVFLLPSALLRCSILLRQETTLSFLGWLLQNELVC